VKKGERNKTSEFRAGVYKHVYESNGNKPFVKIAVLWVVAPSTQPEYYPSFGGAYCPYHQGDEQAAWAARDSKQPQRLGKLIPDGATFLTTYSYSSP
jgi:hypothetical protein